MSTGNPFELLGVPVIINAKGTATRLSGGMMRPDIARAMADATGYCVDMAHLQAVASRTIARHTGAEAGIVTSGAAAGILLGTAAAIAGLDPSAMARLPDTRGLRNEVVMVRSQRNFYDHAARTAGARIREVGLPDRFAGAGIRDAEAWEIGAAIGDRTAAVLYVQHDDAEPPLAEVIAVAHAKGVPVIVDAAAELPPASNLRRFIELGADLVAFSGGKALGGPQASGILCGRRDLVMSAALQMLDLDIRMGEFDPPRDFIDPALLPGLPPHGIGRPCKAGKEQIVGLLLALEAFAGEDEAARHAAWQALLAPIADAAGDHGRLETGGATPRLVLELGERVRTVHDALKAGSPAIHVDTGGIKAGRLAISPLCLNESQAAQVAERLKEILGTRT